MKPTVLAFSVLLLFVACAAQAAEFQVFESSKYGYSLKIPAEFKIEGSEDKTTTWLFQPGAAAAESDKPAAAPAEGKKKGVGGLVKGAAGGLTGGRAKAGAETSAAPKRELEPALTIYVNWVWMPDVATATLFNANKKSDMDNINSPDPDYRDLIVMDKKAGYAIEGGSAYWYKETDKSDPAEIHRWHIKAFGNKSSYTIGLCGTFGQFEKWGPVYEEIVKSFKLIPLEAAK